MIKCTEATYLVDKDLEAKIGWIAKLKLKLHLALCKVCAIYKNQSILLSRTYKKSFGESTDDIFVDQLKKKIKTQIKNRRE